MVLYDSTTIQESHILKINIPRDVDDHNIEISAEESWTLTIKSVVPRSRNFKKLIAILENDVNVALIEAAMETDHGEIVILVPKNHLPVAPRSSILMGPRDNWREHRNSYIFRMNGQGYKRDEIRVTVHRRTFVSVKGGPSRHHRIEIFKGYMDNLFQREDIVYRIRDGAISLVIPKYPETSKTNIRIGYGIHHSRLG